MLLTGEKFCYHIGIVNATCPNLLEMGIWTDATKSLGKTLETISNFCHWPSVDMTNLTVLMKYDFYLCTSLLVASVTLIWKWIWLAQMLVPCPDSHPTAMLPVPWVTLLRCHGAIGMPALTLPCNNCDASVTYFLGDHTTLVFSMFKNCQQPQ